MRRIRPHEIIFGVGVVLATVLVLWATGQLSHNL